MYSEQTLTELDNLKFLGLHINSHFTCKFHIDLLLGKLSTACFVVRKLSHGLGRDANQSAYFAYFPLINKVQCNFLGKFNQCKYGIFTPEEGYNNNKWSRFKMFLRRAV